MKGKIVKHLLSIEELSAEEILEYISLGIKLKSLRGKKSHPRPLEGQTWGLIFEKSSTRTRVSFEVGIRELGGESIFLGIDDIQLGRGETPEDTARVLSRYLHGIAMRTYAQAQVVAFAKSGTIPIINALTDDEHPCQILADLMTWAEILIKKSKTKPKKLTDLFKGKTVAFFGDAACNVPRSWVYAAVKLGFNLRLAAPEAYQLPQEIHQSLKSSLVTLHDDAREAARDADLLYTDTWVSMGKEAESKDRIEKLKPYQINEEIVSLADKDAAVMHCLPAYRGKEITESVFEGHATTIFDEAENRLHVQKAVLSKLSSGR